MRGLLVRLARSRAELDAGLAIRREVFVAEQGVPLELEADGLDAAAEHVVALLRSEVAGCARLRMEGGAARLERVAVRKALRGRGIGRAIVASLVGRARELGAREAVLHAQAATVPFYEQLGFAPRGPRFMEAGIEHVEMAKALGGGGLAAGPGDGRSGATRPAHRRVRGRKGSGRA